MNIFELVKRPKIKLETIEEDMVIPDLCLERATLYIQICVCSHCGENYRSPVGVGFGGQWGISQRSLEIAAFDPEDRKAFLDDNGLKRNIEYVRTDVVRCETCWTWED